MKRALPRLEAERRAADVAARIRSRGPGYLPGLVPATRGLGAGLFEVTARYVEALLERLEQAPEKNQLAFLDLLGIELTPARPARAPVAFQLGEKATAVTLPARTQIAAPPPPEEQSQIVFETEQAVGLSAARIKQVVSLWPGRDQYIDHTQAFLAGQSIRLFERADLEDTAHAVYIAHGTLLALSGEAELEVELELLTPGSETLDVIWEYWDGDVWRGFFVQKAECLELGEDYADGTQGFTRSGRVRLVSECAESAKTTVAGVESFWIRARLDEPLPPDPDQTLPEVSRIRLKSVLRRDLDVFLLPADEPTYFFSTTQRSLKLTFADASGTPLKDVEVELTDVGDASKLLKSDTDGIALFNLSDPEAGESDERELELTVRYKERTFARSLSYRPPAGMLAMHLSLVLQVAGLQPELAFHDAEKLDLTRPIYPLGQVPRPGSTFYLACEEAFTKPGARVTLHVEKAKTPQDDFDVSSAVKADLEPQLAWEYWGPRGWSPLFMEGAELELKAGGMLEFTVPDDMELSKVNDEEALWIRARLVSGSYGFTAKVTWEDADGNTNTFSYVIYRPPALSDVRLSYVWEYGPFLPEHVFTNDDFQFTDRTQAALWPGEGFPLFERVADATPALYVGLSQALPVDRVNLFADIVEEEDEEAVSGSALVWEYFDGSAWSRLAVEDETAGLSHPGMVSFLGAADSAPLARFGVALHWLRARLFEDAPPTEREVRGLYPNAVWVSQRQTVTEEDLGQGTGLPGQVFVVRRPPVLDDEHLEVREAAGARARVEWRIIALDLLLGDERALDLLEERLGEEGSLDVVEGDLRLTRDREKSVSEVWVRWHSVPTLLGSTAADRNYAVDRARGRFAFGDGERGRVPPLGARVVARRYESGGGRVGNVKKGAIAQVLSGVAGIEKLLHPAAAEGGADGEGLAALVQRGPRTLRHRGRALTGGDYEVMAVEASPAVAVARAKPARDPGGRRRAGWVTLVILPRSDEARPQPSFGLRELVRRTIEERAPAGLAGGRIFVTGPEYCSIDVQAAVAPLPTAAAGDVEEAVREAILDFLHPLTGGPEGNGWAEGRDVFLSDLASVLERVEGVDYVRDLVLLRDRRPQGESARVPEGCTAVAGEVRVELV